MSYYPLVMGARMVTVAPVFGDVLTGPPHLLRFSDPDAADAYQIDDFLASQEIIDKEMSAAGCRWAVGAYLENRAGLLKRFPQMVSSGRFFHVGLDIAAPAGTPVYAPLDGVVAELGFDSGVGNYGGYVRLVHDVGGLRFFSFYGHLARPHIVEPRQALRAGEQLGSLGDFEDSGQWFSHLHLQVLTEDAVAAGRTLEGYVDASTLLHVETLFPTPLPLFTY